MEEDQHHGVHGWNSKFIVRLLSIVQRQSASSMDILGR
jgi:hypothetical protein